MKNWKTIRYIIIVILLCFLLWANVSILSNSKWWNGADAWDVEIMKVWWEENWNLIEKIYTNKDYIAQQTEAIDATIAELNWSTYTDEWNTNVEQNQDISAVVEEILATAPIHGNKDARFTILEYSELLCGYCQRQSVNGTIDAVMAEYPNEVNSVHRHYIVHEAALDLASAMECVAELKPDVYYDTLKKAFEQAPASVESIINIASDLGANKNALQSCVDEWRHLESINTMMSQWATLFGIQGTPGNVIIDRETWKYKVLPGAYPAENFIEIIESLKNS